jgi:hypothetical protein
LNFLGAVAQKPTPRKRILDAPKVVGMVDALKDGEALDAVPGTKTYKVHRDSTHNYADHLREIHRKPNIVGTMALEASATNSTHH